MTNQQKQLDLLEAVAEIAYMAGAAHYVTANSRDAISNFIAWGMEFESTPYDPEDYIERIEQFTTTKIAADTSAKADYTTEQLAAFRDILCTIIEGGSGYWASFRNIKRDDLDYLSFEMRDSEDEAAPWRTCNIVTIAESAQRIAEGKTGVNQTLVDKCRDLITVNPGEVDIDADDADTLCQIGLLGELTFS